MTIVERTSTVRTSRRTLEGQSVADVRFVLTTAIDYLRKDSEYYICRALERAATSALVAGRSFGPAVGLALVDGILFEVEQELGEVLHPNKPAMGLPHPKQSPSSGKRARVKLLQKLKKRLCPLVDPPPSWTTEEQVTAQNAAAVIDGALAESSRVSSSPYRSYGFASELWAGVHNAFKSTAPSIDPYYVALIRELSAQVSRDSGQPSHQAERALTTEGRQAAWMKLRDRILSGECKLTLG